MEKEEKPMWIDGIPPRTALGLGAVFGIGAIGVIGFLILLPGAMRGQTKSPTNTAPVAAVPQPAPTPAPDYVPSAPVQITVADGEHVRGNPNAPVTIVEWSDFQCPFCQRFHPTMQQALAEYGDQVRWVYRHFPLESIHPNARPAAEAAECAAEQGRFWEYADQLFDRQAELGSSLYTSLANDLGLNASQFSDCVTTRKYEAKVRDQEQAGLTIGVRGTPGSFVNGVEVPGAVPYAQLKAMIDQALNEQR